MRCELNNRKEIIEKYVKGKLSENERKVFDEHCFNCELCSRELMFYQETAEIIRREGKTVFSDYLVKSEGKKLYTFQNIFDKTSRFLTVKPWRTVVAGAGLAVVVLIFILRQPASVPSKNFETLPYFEEILSDVSRSESITVLSPEVGAVIQDKPLFKWEDLEEERVYLIILDNQGNELFRFTTHKNQFKLSKKLNPGLYYWKLESEEDLLFLGKFVVR